MFEQWPDIDPAVTGMASAALSRPNELLRTLERAVAGQGYLEWARYAAAAEMHRQVVDFDLNSSNLLLDAEASCAARLAAAQNLSQAGAESFLTRGLALRDRLPMVALMLKHGRVSHHHIATIVSRTDLAEGSEFMADIDRDIAESLYRRGSWSKGQMRNMVDANIYRRDPDLVREDRKDAKNKRGVWSENVEHGMAELTAVLSAEDTAMIMQRLEKLAMSTCKRDPRTKRQRMSDALFAISMAREFMCTCPDDLEHPCTADIVTVPADGVISGIDAKIVLHAIANQSTLDGDDEEPAYVDGHGVISSDHARDIADREDTVVRPMGNQTQPDGPAAADGSEINASSKKVTGTEASSDRGASSDSADPAGETIETGAHASDVWDRRDRAQTPQHDGYSSVHGESAPVGLESEVNGATASSNPDRSIAHMHGPEDRERDDAQAETTPEGPGDNVGGCAEEPDSQPDVATTAPPRGPDIPRADSRCRTPSPNRKTRRATRKTASMASPPDPRLADTNSEDWQRGTPSRVQTIPLPTMQPGDHYRPSAVLDAYLRIRDCYCTWPGCDKRAWTADLDHTDEYNHADPTSGGRTHPSGMKALCRFHHMLKTHTTWLDDQYVDAEGRTRTTVTTPEGRIYDGPAWTGEDLFPALQRIIWDDSSPSARRNKPDNPLRTQSRIAAKHARRRQERMRNRLRREAIEEADGPPLF